MKPAESEQPIDAAVQTIQGTWDAVSEYLPERIRGEHITDAVHRLGRRLAAAERELNDARALLVGRGHTRCNEDLARTEAQLARAIQERDGALEMFHNQARVAVGAHGLLEGIGQIVDPGPHEHDPMETLEMVRAIVAQRDRAREALRGVGTMAESLRTAALMASKYRADGNVNAEPWVAQLGDLVALADAGAEDEQGAGAEPRTTKPVSGPWEAPANADRPHPPSPPPPAAESAPAPPATSDMPDPHSALGRRYRDLILDASEEELREAFGDEQFERDAAAAVRAIERALKRADGAPPAGGGEAVALRRIAAMAMHWNCYEAGLTENFQTWQHAMGLFAERLQRMANEAAPTPAPGGEERSGGDRVADDLASLAGELGGYGATADRLRANAYAVRTLAAERAALEERERSAVNGRREFRAALREERAKVATLERENAELRALIDAVLVQAKDRQGNVLVTTWGPWLDDIAAEQQRRKEGE